MAVPQTVDLPRHLRLSIHHQWKGGFRIDGDDRQRIRRLHPTGKRAEDAIRDYCLRNQCTASVQIYYPPKMLWRNDTIDANGILIRACPGIAAAI